jgi:RNA polymerase sigma-70 factor (ECF subfamily)
MATLKNHPTEETRHSLLVKVSRGDSEGWSEFVSLYEPLLLSYVLSRGLPRHEAADVVQEIFIKLFRTLPSFKLDHQRGRFRTWLWQITSTTIADWARQKKRRARLNEREREHQVQREEASLQPDAAWDTAFEQRVLNFVLQSVRETTQAKTWTCFEEHLLKGRPSAQVGLELGLSANSVNVNASRVLARVRELSEYYREELGDE